MSRGKAAAQIIITQPAKSSLLPTLLLLEPLLLLTSQMATLGLTTTTTSSTRGIPFLSASGLHTGVSVYPLKGEWGLAITCSRQIPFPAIPPYFVKTLHIHGTRTSDATYTVKTTLRRSNEPTVYVPICMDTHVAPRWYANRPQPYHLGAKLNEKTRSPDPTGAPRATKRGPT